MIIIIIIIIMANITDEEYLKKADSIARNLVQCVVDQGEVWKLIKEVDNVQVFSKPSPDTKGNMYKVETILDACPEKVLACANPAKSYRIQWDEYLAELTVEKKLNENVFLIYHGTKSMLGGLVSARDSLDACTIAKIDDYYYVAAGTVDHVNYPPRENSVRIHQYAAGYVIFPVEGMPNKCRFVMVMNTDMKMNALGNFLTEPVKPRLLLEKIKNLRRGLQTLDIVYE